VVAERFGPSDEHAAGVIVLGAGNQSVLGGVLGSVVARVVHDTNRPVLVIPAPPEGR
jgi:nucleotide-binding universal stress UspA family protein